MSNRGTRRDLLAEGVFGGRGPRAAPGPARGRSVPASSPARSSCASRTSESARRTGRSSRLASATTGPAWPSTRSYPATNRRARSSHWALASPASPRATGSCGVHPGLRRMPGVREGRGHTLRPTVGRWASSARTVPVPIPHHAGAIPDKVPEPVTLAQAALTEPLAVSSRGCAAGIEAHGDDPKRCAVFGAGTIGHLAAQVLKQRGTKSPSSTSSRAPRPAGRHGFDREGVHRPVGVRLLVEATGSQRPLSVLQQASPGTCCCWACLTRTRLSISNPSWRSTGR